MLQSRRTLPGALAALFLSMLPPAGASAATITGFGSIILPGFSTGAFGPVQTLAPNNDNAAADSPNTIPYSVFFNTQGVLDAEFLVAPSGGTTEYRVTQTLVNNTGANWSGFRYQLGYGTGTAFVPSGEADALDLDAPDRDPAPFSSRFATVAAGADLLLWSGGVVPSIGGVFQTLAIDVPDNLADFNPAGLSRFTLRQTPVPEALGVPAPGGLAVIGPLIGLLLVARRRRA